MPKFRNLIASIKVDGNEIPEYSVQVEDSEKQVSCWIASEVGKKFSVCWQCLKPLATATSGYVTIDGISVGGIYGSSNTKAELLGCQTSATTRSDFRFSQMTYTDDDSYLNAAIANIGEIKLEVWTVLMGEAIPWSFTRTLTSDMKVHERSKKLGSHCVKFDDPKSVAPRNHCNKTTKISRLATFIFTYRPLDMLQANGIAPLPASAEQGKGNNKRKTLEDDVDIKEETSGDEDDDDDDDDIDDRVRKLKDKLRRLESRRSKKRMVKKEDRLPITNEVIDLT